MAASTRKEPWMAENLRELFDHELRDLYDVEKKLTRAVASMSKKVKDPQLKSALEEHLTVTEGQAARLEEVFAAVGRKPRREPCKGIDGLIEEFKKFVEEEKPAKPILDTFAAGAAKKVEHYEILSYKSLIELANKLGLEDVVPLLEQSLSEEEEAATTLESFDHLLDAAEPGEISVGEAKTTARR